MYLNLSSIWNIKLKPSILLSSTIMKLHLLIPAVAAIFSIEFGPVLAAPKAKVVQQPKQTQLYRGPRTTALNTSTDQRFALINTDGTISRSIGGVVSSQGFSSIGFTGRYEVVFNRDVTQCMYLGNVGAPGASGADEGTVSFTSRTFNSNGVFVERRDVAGNFVDGPFFVGVFCPRVTR